MAVLLMTFAYDLDKESYPLIQDKMPKFLLQFEDLYFPGKVFEYKGTNYTRDELGKHPWKTLMTAGIDENMNLAGTWKLYEDCAVALTDGGHNLPIKMSDRNFAKMTQFIKDRYVEKNGNDDGFTVPFDHFNF